MAAWPAGRTATSRPPAAESLSQDLLRGIPQVEVDVMQLWSWWNKDRKKNGKGVVRTKESAAAAGRCPRRAHPDRRRGRPMRRGGRGIASRALLIGADGRRISTFMPIFTPECATLAAGRRAAGAPVAYSARREDNIRDSDTLYGRRSVASRLRLARNDPDRIFYF